MTNYKPRVCLVSGRKAVLYELSSAIASLELSEANAEKHRKYIRLQEIELREFNLTLELLGESPIDVPRVPSEDKESCTWEKIADARSQLVTELEATAVRNAKLADDDLKAIRSHRRANRNLRKLVKRAYLEALRVGFTAGRCTNSPAPFSSGLMDDWLEYKWDDSVAKTGLSGGG